MPWFNLPGFNTTPSVTVPLPFPIQSALTPNYIVARSTGQNPVRATVSAVGSATSETIQSAKEGVEFIKKYTWLILLGVLAILYFVYKRKS
jgi:hypothetical protein